MTTGICDMHCHILPKLDDGSKSMEETVRTVQEAVNQGIRTIIATPHFYPGRYETEAKIVLQKVENVQLICQERNPSGADFMAGQECFLLFRTSAAAKGRKGTDTGRQPVCAGGIFSGLYVFSAVWRTL